MMNFVKEFFALPAMIHVAFGFGIGMIMGSWLGAEGNLFGFLISIVSLAIILVSGKKRAGGSSSGARPAV